MMRCSILFFLLACASAAHASDLESRPALPICTTGRLSETKKQELAQYVIKKYHLAGSASVQLTGEDLDSNTCYRKVYFVGRNATRTWRLTLYLSPDERYLSPDIFDTSVDPIEEERRKNKALMSDLAQNKGTSKGPANAPVTIVEFSDFECPYCRRFEEVMKQVMPEEKNGVRIVFHHLPLQMHPWARAAAEGAACAQLQSSEAFWSIHDQLFDHQTEITAANIHQQLLDFAKDAKSLDLQQFQTCLDNQMSLGLVLRDINLASANNINATPTLFINGERIQGIKDSAELRRLIDEARKESDADSSSK